MKKIKFIALMLTLIVGMFAFIYFDNKTSTEYNSFIGFTSLFEKVEFYFRQKFWI